MEPQVIPPFLYHLARLRRRDSWTRERLAAHQARALAELRAYAVQHSPFYRELHRGSEDAPLDQLPVVSRENLLDRFDDIVTDRRVRLADVQRHMETATPGTPYLGRYRLTTSTGSSGGRVSIVLHTPLEWAFSLASAARSRDLAGAPWSPLRRVRAAFVVSRHEWTSSAKLATSARSWSAPQVHLDANAPIGSLVAQLNDWQPGLLTGFGSVIEMLAEEQLAGRLRISPQFVSIGGEVTLPEVRRRIAAAWGSEPFDLYGTTEGGTIAAECRAGRRMHLFEDATLTEVVDEQNRPVTPGTWGAKVLVTPLWCRTQPIIRFETNDVVRVSPDPCVCGRATRVLDGIRGRAPHVITLPAASGTGTVSFSWMSLALGVTELPATYRTCDMEGDVFVVSLGGLATGYDLGPLARQIRAEFEAHGAIPPSVEFRLLAETPRGPGGKAAVTER